MSISPNTSNRPAAARQGHAGGGSLRHRVLAEIRAMRERLMVVERLLEQPSASSSPRPPARGESSRRRAVPRRPTTPTTRRGDLFPRPCAHCAHYCGPYCECSCHRQEAVHA